MRALAALTALTASLVACAASEDTSATADEAALNGRVATNKHPSVVHLMDGQTPFCVGTLVAPLVVVTAGHCAQELLASRQRGVLVGSGAYGAPVRSANAFGRRYGTEVDVYQNDIGVVMLAQPIELGSYPSLASVANGQGGLAVGHMHGNNVYANQVLEANTGAITVPQDNAMLSTRAVASHGDSGGPLFVNGALVGVISAVGTRTTHYGRVDLDYARIQPIVDSQGGW